MATDEREESHNLELRRHLAGLIDGAQIPGYQGYCPQLKYNIGRTFGQETSRLAHLRRCDKHQSLNDDQERLMLAFSDLSLVPDSTGDNKYTKNMVPGYTGWIPRLPFRFSKTYKEECDMCLAEFMVTCQQTKRLENEIRTLANRQPPLRAVSADPFVRDSLNIFSDQRLLSAPSPRRQSTEAPIPGYRGYVPRVNVTELGLSSRYHETAQNGLNEFFSQSQYRPINSGNLNHITIERNPVSSIKTGNRIYLRDGMVPKYTGYIPQQRYAFGNTYGNETRSLQVCAHNQPSYGAFVRQQTVA